MLIQAAQQIDSISSLVNQIPLINFLFLGANTYFMLNIKLAISKLETKIAEDRRNDADSMRDWVREEVREHTQHCSSFKQMLGEGIRKDNG